MPRLRENYICSSEDRAHYNHMNNNNYYYDYYYNYYYPPKPSENNIIDSSSGLSQEQIKKLINERISQLKETLVEEINSMIDIKITTQDVDAVIDEIYGGSASDVMKEE